jgi:hypothetical protein
MLSKIPKVFFAPGLCTLRGARIEFALLRLLVNRYSTVYFRLTCFLMSNHKLLHFTLSRIRDDPEHLSDLFILFSEILTIPLIKLFIILLGELYL